MDNFKGFATKHLIIPENNKVFRDIVSETYNQFVSSRCLCPSSGDIADLIEFQNEEILTEFDNEVNEFIKKYNNLYSNTIHFGVEAILNDLGVTHSVLKRDRTVKAHPLQLFLIDEWDLYKEELYAGYSFFKHL